MKNSFLMVCVCVVASSCASVKKSGSRTESTSKHTDSTTTQKEQTKTTTILETAGTPVSTRPDSARIVGYLPTEDTTGFTQRVTAGSVTLSTIVKPRRNSQGTTTGYSITSSVTKAAEVITAPVNRQITIAEAGKELQQAAVKDATTEKSATSDKSVFRFNVAGAIAMVCCVIGAIALYLLYKYLKKR